MSLILTGQDHFWPFLRPTRKVAVIIERDAMSMLMMTHSGNSKSQIDPVIIITAKMIIGQKIIVFIRTFGLGLVRLW